jgi:DNA-binding MarR family transcriptional regulator
MSARADQETTHRPTIEDLRAAVSQMFGAERRLRSREHSRPGELTHAQLRALFTLGKEREMTAGQLARSADLNPASVTPILDQLEAANVLERHRSTEDRRVLNVSLTPEGRQLLERKLEHWQSVWDERFAEFPDRDLNAAIRVLNEITDIYEGISARLDSVQAKTRPD